MFNVLKGNPLGLSSDLISSLYFTSNGNDNVTDDDIVAAGFDKRGQLDKRQEMLQKARERFKKGVKSKEVIVNNKGGSGQSGPSIKISKEELNRKF